jgi:hypothetical protein
VEEGDDRLDAAPAKPAEHGAVAVERLRVERLAGPVLQARPVEADPVGIDMERLEKRQILLETLPLSRPLVGVASVAGDNAGPLVDGPALDLRGAAAAPPEEVPGEALGPVVFAFLHGTPRPRPRR